MQRTILLLLSFALAAGAAQAEEKYQRKSGLWEVKRTSTRTEDKERTYQVCVDHVSDDALRQLAGGMRSERCQASKAVRDGDKLVVDATCKVAKTSTATTHAVITGKFDSAYKVESKSTFDPPVKGKSEGSTVMEAKWTGPCKANQKPGDVILPNGAKVSSLTDEAPAADNAARPAHERGARKRGGYVPAPAPATPAPAPTTK